MPKLNLVFQGGGVRGIAHAAALKTMPTTVKIHAVGGTSAGAIVASLLAIGKSPQELISLLDREQLAKFLSKDDRERAHRLQESFQRIKDVCANFTKSGGKISQWQVISLVWHLKKSFPKDLKHVCDAKGLFATTALRAWLDVLFGSAKFSQIQTYDLRVVAADTQERGYKIFSRELTPETTIADAVHQSVSIPLFFHPFRQGNGYMVDGGVLSNFPAFLFAQASYPTVGFRLRDVELPSDDGIFGFLGSLLATMVEAHDKQRDLPDDFKGVDIIATSVPSFRFDLAERDQAALMMAGEAAGKSVNWESHAAPAPFSSAYDSKPQKALDQSMAQAHRLFDITNDKSYWPSEIIQYTKYKIFLEDDWSAKYEMITELEIQGDFPLSIFRTRIYHLPTDQQARLNSILDCDFEHAEIVDKEEIPLVKIPCVNLENEKHFVTFCWPPLSQSSGRRTFVMRWSVNKEFAAILSSYVPGVRPQGDLSYGTKQRGQRHKLTLDIELYVHTSLPHLKIPSAAGGVPFNQLAAKKLKTGTYHPYFCEGIVRNVVDREKIELLLSRE